MATRPQTIGYALLDSPVALAAWMVDHDTDAYYKIAGAFVDGRALGQPHPRPHPRQHHAVLADRHRRLRRPVVLGGAAPTLLPQAASPFPPSTIPFGFTTFPGEIWRTPRSWVEASYPNVIYFNEVDKGGHFAAWEEPELFPPRSARRSGRFDREERDASLSETTRGRRLHDHHTSSIATEIRPFQVDIPDQAIDDLRRRIASTRLPPDFVEDRSQGVQLEPVQELARYWATEYAGAMQERGAERTPSVHDRDRWAGLSFHPCEVGP